MPFVRIWAAPEIPASELQRISDAVHDALVSIFQAPAKDRFQVVTRQGPGELVCTPEYLGIAHEGPVVFIQITCNEGRTIAMKQSLFARLSSSIEAGGVVRAADVIVNLVEVHKENWSFGNGIAQYVT